MKLENELQSWLKLWLAPKMTTSYFYALLKQFPDLTHFFNLAESQWKALRLPEETINHLKNPTAIVDQIDKILEWKNQPKCHILLNKHTIYPPLLKEIKNPPPILFVKGDMTALTHPQISIIGSRKPTPLGIEVTKELAYELSTVGLTITSGLAIGIDTAAHLGALIAKGTTIAVLGSGIERIYPLQNNKLVERIIDNGAIISEFGINEPPKRENFPQRNRIVSGLSLGTLVVEAGLRSGSLITAHFAAEQGREVFAVPGSIKNLQSCGCHLLIQQGAKLTQKITDVLEELKGFDYVAHKNKKEEISNWGKNGLTTHEQKLLACLGYEPTPIDLIKERSKLDIIQINEILCNLKIKNYIKNTFNGFIKIK